MREIKFRAWYGEKIGMLEPTFNGSINEIFAERNGEYMQYTGLKDKNGKEIYEGDVYHQGDPKITYTVVWHDTGFKGKQNSSSSYAGLEHWQERIEVVGNIYEPKE
ncbi:hypothetical protein CHH91_04425 [Virgibacillus sp. 7505]|uniref:YopX family protein n=1 Tax=Virgibacillus sp. 7505 TaxID=2022548 RepID=UPI000BA7A2B4|nr:YopX family protein [Virgibacillus sp. 7505]PAE17258.1 hypothetical protein CHH91_04425 [Virgibacillus sp. 7505]